MSPQPPINVPTQAALSRFGRTDFFASFPPGLYIFLIIPILIISYLHLHEFAVIDESNPYLKTIVFEKPNESEETTTTEVRPNQGVEYKNLKILRACQNPDIKQVACEKEEKSRYLPRQKSEKHKMYITTFTAYHWAIFEWVLDRFWTQPLIIFLSIFLTFIFGSFIRLHAVSNADGVPIAGNTEERFPYPKKMCRITTSVDEVLKADDIPYFFIEYEKCKSDHDKIKAFEEYNLHVFNAMKQFLSTYSANSYDYYLNYEFRTRFIAGMRHSSLIAIQVCGIIFFTNIILFFSVIPPHLHWASFPWLAVNWSYVLYFIFSCFLFRWSKKAMFRVRVQEAEDLVTRYLTLRYAGNPVSLPEHLPTVVVRAP